MKIGRNLTIRITLRDKITNAKIYESTKKTKKKTERRMHEEGKEEY